MPELPEVETLRLQLDQALTSLKITDIQILNEKSFQGDLRGVRGLRVLRVGRRAKIIIIELEDNLFLAIHLKLTGQLIYKKDKKEKKDQEAKGPFSVQELPNKFTRVITSFDNGGRLYFNDLRMFGWIKILNSKEQIAKISEKIGPEANDEKAFTFDYFKNILAKTKKPIKLVLLDQAKLAGVGNIYANEALFRAGIMPTRPANSVNDNEIKKLRDAIINVLNEAIKLKGTSGRDEAFRQITGEKGEFQNFLLVYGKTGQTCPKCGGKIERTSVGGRGTFFCPRCQK